VAPSSDTTGVAFRKRILIVDDNNDGAEMLSEALTMSGHQTEVASDGAEALACAALFEPEVCLIDIGLPGMDGYELARRLRAKPATANARLIAVTGFSQPSDRGLARDAGFDLHLAKPVELDQLQQAIAGLSTARI